MKSPLLILSFLLLLFSCTKENSLKERNIYQIVSLLVDDFGRPFIPPPPPNEINTYTDIQLDSIFNQKQKISIYPVFQKVNNNSWKNLKSIIKIESVREFKNSFKPLEKATRYYISSLKVDAKTFQKNIRLHWSIENSLHWVLDVAFSEDASRKRAGNSPENFSILSKIALNLLKNETTEKQGIKGKRLKCAYNQDYLLKVINLKV